MTESLYSIEGVVQHYAWGGTEFLPELLHRPNPSAQPWAEYWMGAHAKGPATVAPRGGSLAELISRGPAQTLGAAVANRFADRLPFLFKVLDVKEMLSIQVHPTKAAAEEGFAREEASGPERSAPDRNYRDDNHKPELGVAVTDFYLLHGFRSAAEIAATLDEVPGWAELRAPFERGGVAELYAHVMRAEQSEIDRLLGPLADSLATGEFDRSQPAFWARRAVEQYTRDGHHDRGMFSIYWFNLVHLTPGQGIFQDAGIPHAYLEGVCIELMANSDNVLRGGLTPKHIDVPELLDKTRFAAVTPERLRPVTATAGWERYPTPAPDFALWRARPDGGTTIELPAEERPSILLLLSGEVGLGGTDVTLRETARTAFVPAGQSVTLAAQVDSIVYRATVGDL